MKEVKQPFEIGDDVIWMTMPNTIGMVIEYIKNKKSYKVSFKLFVVEIPEHQLKKYEQGISGANMD